MFIFFILFLSACAYQNSIILLIVMYKSLKRFRLQYFFLSLWNTKDIPNLSIQFNSVWKPLPYDIYYLIHIIHIPIWIKNGSALLLFFNVYDVNRNYNISHFIFEYYLYCKRNCRAVNLFYWLPISFPLYNLEPNTEFFSISRSSREHKKSQTEYQRIMKGTKK